MCRIGTHSSNDLVLARSRGLALPLPPRRARTAAGACSDTGSLNGTTLDGVRIRDADLRARGRIALGDSRRPRPRQSRRTDAVVVPMMPRVRRARRDQRGDAQALRDAREGRAERHQRPHRRRERHRQGARRDRDRPARPARRQAVRRRRLRRHLARTSSRASSSATCAAPSPAPIAIASARSRRPTAARCSSTRSASCRSSSSRSSSARSRRARSAASARRAPRKVNVRVIAATNRDLEREVNEGRFREDLYFRLAVISVRVPPLRERLDDLPHPHPRASSRTLGVPRRGATSSRRRCSPRCATHDWPGNVRELRNYVERSVVLQTASLTPPRRRRASSPAHRPERVDLRMPVQAREGRRRRRLRARLPRARSSRRRAAT